MKTLSANYLEIHKEAFEQNCQKSFEETVQENLQMNNEPNSLGIGPLQIVLNIKVEVIPIDKNEQQTPSFEMFKISGKLPTISLLYEGNHYDIIYSKYISRVDGFDTESNQYKGQIIPSNYNVSIPDFPFYKFVMLTQDEKNSPKDEGKALVQIVDQPYFKQQIIEETFNPLECLICRNQFQESEMMKLGCGHFFDKNCLNAHLNKQTNSRYIYAEGDDQKTKANCSYCNSYELNYEELKQLIGSKKFDDLSQRAARRAAQYLKNQDLKVQQELNSQSIQTQKVQQVNLIQERPAQEFCQLDCGGSSQLVIVQCGHKICKDCLIPKLWGQTNGNFIVGEGEFGFGSKCPFEKCKHVLTNEDFQNMLGNMLYEAKYSEFLQRTKK